METTARGDVPKTLQTIAYISIPNSADLEFLLWDLQDAIAAYAQLSGTALPRPVDLKANDAGSVADGIVLAIEDVADDETLTAIEQALERFGGTGTRVYVAIRAAQEGTEQARGTAVRLHKACERHGQCGVAALPSAPAAALRRFVALRAWDSCGDRFLRPWTSSWAPCAWAAPSSMHSDLAAAMPPTSTPTAWFAPSQPCPRRSGEAF